MKLKLSTVVAEPNRSCAEEDDTVRDNQGRNTLRVCHVIGALDFGGAERQVVNLVNHLPVAERHVLLLTEGLNRGLEDQLRPEVVKHVLPMRLRSLPHDLGQIVRLLRRQRFDVLHTHMYWANLIGSLAGKLASVPVVITGEHGRNLWKHRGHRLLERNFISAMADLRVCASEDILKLRRDSDGVPVNKLMTLPNGTGIPTLPPRRDNPELLIGTVGRLVPAKDYTTLLKASGRLREAGVRFRLCIVGEGPERPRLERTASELGLRDQVEFAGAQKDISSWLQRFDLFVLSSVREGQPLALLEAMAHGLPIVATRVGGIPLTVSDGTEALLVEAKQPNRLADAMKRLSASGDLRSSLGAQARLRAERDYSIQAVATKYAQLYQLLWDRKHAAKS